MCLQLEPSAKLKTAHEDIVCYKILNSETFSIISEYKSGDEFVGVIDNEICKGIISIENHKMYFCTSNPNLNGEKCNDTQGYPYSWVFDHTVDLEKQKSTIFH